MWSLVMRSRFYTVRYHIKPIAWQPLRLILVVMWIQADSMKNIKWVKNGFALLMSFAALSAIVPPAFAGESTMPSS